MKKYEVLLDDVGALLEEGRKHAYQAVNSILVKTYWEIGKRIVEYEQKGNEKAKYGSALLLALSKDLSLKYGGDLAEAISRICDYFISNFKNARHGLAN